MTRVSLHTKGTQFIRCVIAEAARDNTEDRIANAAQLYGEKSLQHRIATSGGLSHVAQIKAEVAAGATVSGSWAELLAETETATFEFFELVRARSLIGRIPGLRDVPLRTRLIGLASGFAAAWVGEGKAVPISKATFDQNTLAARRVSCLTVVTNELLAIADARAEAIIRDDMVKAIALAIDTSFIDPANAGETDVQPASVTNAATSVASSGNGLQDIRNLIYQFPGELERAVLIGSGESFASLFDPLELPNLGVRGGSALGIPAIATAAAGDTLALIDPDGIAIGGGDVDVTTARQASIEMLDSSLTGDSIGVVPPTAASTVSLWQTNSTAVLADARVNWEVARPSVKVVEGVAAS